VSFTDDALPVLNDELRDKVNASKDQTINGEKTFGEIPLLPASNPSSDNQAARKAYVDTKAASGANSDITSLSGLTTPLSIAQGGTGLTTGDSGLKLGSMTFESSGSVGESDRIFLAKFKCIKNCTVTQLGLACIYHSGTLNIKLGIYSDNSGTPNTLLGSTSAISIPASTYYCAVESITAVNLTGGTDYWLAYIFDGGHSYYNTFGTTSSTNFGLINTNTYASGFPNPYSSAGQSAARRWALFAY